MENTLQQNPASSKRMLGLDILKILSMFLIIIHHVSFKGDFIQNATGFNLVLLSFLNALFLPSVNIFVYVSAYLIVKKGKTSLNNLIKLYFQIVFYALLTYFFVCCLNYQTFSVRTLIECFFPVTKSHFWFCREYLILYALSPLLLKIVQNLNKNEYTYTVLFILIALVYTTFFEVDILPLNKGFNSIWFIVLFMLAGYHAKFGLEIKKSVATLIFILCTIYSYVIFIFNNTYFLADYTNFITVIQTISLFQLVHDIKSTNKYITKTSTYIATCTLGIYLLHDGNFVFQVLYKEIFQTHKYNLSSNALIYFFAIVSIIFIAGILVETLRKLIIKLFKKIILKIKTKLSYQKIDHKS